MDTLKPNREMLNSSFEGYTLGKEVLKSVSIPLSQSFTKLNIFKDLLCQTFMLFHETYNHLYYDHWNGNVYFVDEKLNIFQIRDKEGNGSFLHLCSKRLNETSNKNYDGTLSFPSEDLCLLADGSQYLYLLKTGDRSTKDALRSWYDMDKNPVYKFDEPFYLLHSILEKKRNILHVLLISLKRTPDECAVLRWLQFQILNDNDTKCLVGKSKSFKGECIPKAYWFDDGYDKLFVCVNKEYHMINELNKDLDNIPNLEEKKCNKTDSPKWYEWHQCTDSLLIRFDACVEEREIVCNFFYDTICVKLSNGKVLLEGSLEKHVTVESCKWYITDNRLEVFLLKKVTGEFWNSVVPNDDHGIHKVEGEEQEHIERILQRMEHLTSDKTLPAKGIHEDFNMQQLEECDENVDEDFQEICIDVNNGNVENVRNLSGYQWIFSSSSGHGKPPSICLRYDVDGLVFTPRVDTTLWDHVATIDAFGYVCASKQNRKYVACSPSFRYVVITDYTSHVYVYESIGANKTQRSQYVVTIPDNERILGCQVTENNVYVLSDKQVTVIQLPRVDIE